MHNAGWGNNGQRYEPGPDIFHSDMQVFLISMYLGATSEPALCSMGPVLESNSSFLTTFCRCCMREDNERELNWKQETHPRLHGIVGGQAAVEVQCIECNRCLQETQYCKMWKCELHWLPRNRETWVGQVWSQQSDANLTLMLSYEKTSLLVRFRKWN